MNRPRRLRPCVGPRPGALVLALAGLAATAAIAQGAASTATVVRTSVDLSPAKRDLGPWTALKGPGAKVVFRPDARGVLLRLADGPRHAAFVAVSTKLTPQSAVGLRAEVNLAEQTLEVVHARSVVAVGSQTGDAIQAGLFRTGAGPGKLRWAMWHKTASGERDSIVVSSQPATLRRWHSLELVTRWNRPDAKAVLRVDGRVVAQSDARDLTAILAQNVTVGLGRVSALRETGAMLVRSAEVKAAVGAAPSPPDTTPPGTTPPGTTPPGTTPPGTTPPGTTGPAATETLPGREIFRGDYETGNLRQWSDVQAVSSDRIQVVKSPVRQGTYAGRFEVRPGDDPIGSGNDRAELSLDTGEADGMERWYAWSSMITDSVPDRTGFQAITQWQSRDYRTPPVGVFVADGELVIFVHRMNGDGSLIQLVKIWHGPLRRGTWQDLKFHIKWSPSDSVGYIEFWVNGVRQTFDNGTQRRYIRTLQAGFTSYMKQGYYRTGGTSGSGVVYHDGLRITNALG